MGRLSAALFCAAALACAAPGPGKDGGPGGGSGGSGGSGGGSAGGSGGSGGSAGGSGGAAGGSGGSGGGAGGGVQAPLNVIVFTRTLGFRHGSIPVAQAMITNLGSDGGWTVELSEDAGTFTASRLATTDVVVFANTTGDVLTATEEPIFEAWIRGGGGFVGIHSATDTEYGWPFYGELIGARFANHPAIQQATMRVETPSHPTAGGIPAAWVRTDEWYNFQSSPRPGSTVVLTLDESTYTGGTMGTDHPAAWAREVDAGRGYYMAGGHTDESYSEAIFVEQIKAAIEWAGRRR